MKQTVVEFLVEQFEEIHTIKRWQQIVEQAKEMEKEHIKDAFKYGVGVGSFGTSTTSEQYYNKTFKSK